MIDLQNTHHHVEFVDLPELRPLELFGLYKLSRFLEPFTNRLIMMCEVQTMNGNRVVKREIKPVNVRTGDIPEIVGCSTVTANRLVRTFREKNIMLRDKAFFINPKFVRAHNALGTANTVALFEQNAQGLKTADTAAAVEDAFDDDPDVADDNL